ncbi:MAG: SDR family oxidoreductase [Bacteroidota bacterium]|nr:SDR family oxidoreductase [Bacteroidota bacterium]
MKYYKDLFNLEEKTILVAGGAGQIGFSFCTILADAGAKVIILDIDQELAVQKLHAFQDEEIKSKIYSYYLDVEDKSQIHKVLLQISKEHPIIYGLVNAFHFKGSTRKLDIQSNFFSDFEHYPEDAWDKVHDVNLKGTFLLSQAIIPYFKQNKQGVIVNISSSYGNVSANKNIYGTSGINSPVAYASSKAAIINLTRYMATHLADDNIRVNCLSPGGVFNNQTDEFVKNYKALTPLKRMANPEDYQGAILFLMSNASSYMTGANLIIDGGWTAW